MSLPRLPDVKICGLCHPDDASYAVEAGATHVGVIRVLGSRRTQPARVARDICAAAAGARKVGVYVDASVATILREAESLGLDVIQLHGQEDPELLESLAGYGYEVWKVLKPLRAEDLLEGARRYRLADMLLVEGRSRRGHGGVGARFPWDEVEAAVDTLPAESLLGVGGGLTPENVTAAVRRFRPTLVDVSSGVELEVGRKDRERVRAFIEAARQGSES